MIRKILNKLSKEEIKWITTHSYDLKEACENEQPPKPKLECKIGDCFIETSNDGWINLYKITEIDDINVEFDEIDINVNSNEILIVEDYISREIAYEHFEPISTELYKEINKTVTTLSDTVENMYKGVVTVIKKLCQEKNENL